MRSFDFMPGAAIFQSVAATDGGFMTLDTLEMAQAMRRSGLPQEQADTIAEQIGKGFRSDDLATKEFVRGELAKLSSDLSWRLVGMLLVQAGLVVTLVKLL